MLRDTLERACRVVAVVGGGSDGFAFLGFSGTYLLMDNQGLNFFLVFWRACWA